MHVQLRLLFPKRTLHSSVLNHVNDFNAQSLSIAGSFCFFRQSSFSFHCLVLFCVRNKFCCSYYHSLSRLFMNISVVPALALPLWSSAEMMMCIFRYQLILRSSFSMKTYHMLPCFPLTLLFFQLIQESHSPCHITDQLPQQPLIPDFVKDFQKSQFIVQIGSSFSICLC